MNSGEFWERSENEMLGGAQPLDWNAVVAFLLMVLVFIDGTALVPRGTLSAVPIILSLGNFPERIWNKLAAWVVAGRS